MNVRKRKHGLGKKGYTLAELMVVVAIMAVLTAGATGVYTGYVEKAKTSALLNTVNQVKTALLICEAEYLAANPKEEMMFWSEEFLAMPNDPDSILYPYVGEVTQDCTGYTLKLAKSSGKVKTIAGFTYETDEYRAVWKRDGEITVTKQE